MVMMKHSKKSPIEKNFDCDLREAAEETEATEIEAAVACPLSIGHGPNPIKQRPDFIIWNLHDCIILSRSISV